MLPLQPHRPGKYPLGPKFAQFGDDLLGESITHAAHASLVQKRAGNAQFHMDRLQQDGFTPMTHTHAAAAVEATVPPYADQQQQAVAEYDAPMQAHVEHHIIDSDGESSGTISPVTSPRPSAPSVVRRLAGAGFEFAGNAAGYMGGALQNNVAAGADLARAGAQVVGQVANVVRNTSQRVASASASKAVEVAGHAHEAASSAMTPGSNTRRSITSGASTVAGTAKDLIEASGPPIAYGAHLAGKATVAAARGAGHATVLAAKGVKNVAMATADVTSNHLLPAAGAVARRGAQMAASALSASTLSAIDIINAIREMRSEGELEPETQYSAYNALGNGDHMPLEYGKARRKRGTTPPPRSNTKASSSSAPATSTRTAQEWMEYAGNKQRLVEELLQRPNWKSFVKNVRDTPELRKKLHTLSQHDLAEILAQM